MLTLYAPRVSECDALPADRQIVAALVLTVCLFIWFYYSIDYIRLQALFVFFIQEFMYQLTRTSANPYIS